MFEMELSNKKILRPKAQISYRILSNIIIDNEDLTLIHFISSEIDKTKFNNICFYNASFLSTKFICTDFNICNLENTDICSIWVKECNFDSSIIDNSTVSDSTFINCTFDNTSFVGVTMTNCTFINCIFNSFPIENSTITLNTFENCIIRNSVFTVSFYYQIFINCQFENTDFPLELMGYNFGLMSSKINNSNESVKIENHFIERGFLINAAIFRINCENKYYDQSLLASIYALEKMMDNNILIKTDEVRFLKNLTSNFIDRNQIAPIILLKIVKKINNIMIKNESKFELNKSLYSLKEYMYASYFKYNSFLKKVNENNEKLFKFSANCESVLKITYRVQPLIPFIFFLKQFNSYENKSMTTPELIKTEKGSFIEYHRISSILLPYIQTLFSFLGVIAPIAIYKNQNKEVCKTEDKSTNLSVSIKINSPNDEQSNKIYISDNHGDKSISIITEHLISDKSNEIIKQSIEMIDKNLIDNSPDYAGYNASNVKSIEINIQ